MTTSIQSIIRESSAEELERLYEHWERLPVFTWYQEMESYRVLQLIQTNYEQQTGKQL